jgi:hypothetical protein
MKTSSAQSRPVAGTARRSRQSEIAASNTGRESSSGVSIPCSCTAHGASIITATVTTLAIALRVIRHTSCAAITPAVSCPRATTNRSHSSESWIHRIAAPTRYTTGGWAAATCRYRRWPCNSSRAVSAYTPSSVFHSVSRSTTCTTTNTAMPSNIPAPTRAAVCPSVLAAVPVVAELTAPPRRGPLRIGLSRSHHPLTPRVASGTSAAARSAGACSRRSDQISTDHRSVKRLPGPMVARSHRRRRWDTSPPAAIIRGARRLRDGQNFCPVPQSATLAGGCGQHLSGLVQVTGLA